MEETEISGVNQEELVRERVKVGLNLMVNRLVEKEKYICCVDLITILRGL